MSITVEYSKKNLETLALSGIKPTAIKVLLYLYGRADSSGIVRPSIEDSAGKDGMSLDLLHNQLGLAKTTLSRAVNELKDANIVKVVLVKGVRAEYFLQSVSVWNLPDQ